jgi:hypothetical protein
MNKPLYTVNWDIISGYEELDGYKLPMPEMPPFEEMENYELPVEEQKFRRTVTPKTLLKRKSHLSKEEEKFIRDEYHKIHNGVWYLIKGKPVYFTGAYYFFVHYWVTQKSVIPDFRFVQCLIFLFWEMCVLDKDCYGMFLVKPRRIGGTEMTIELEYIDALRYRDMVCGMQSKDEDSVFKNYQRIIKANKSMIWFFKPITAGSSDNKDGLFFKYPAKNNTEKAMRELAERGEEIETVYEDEEIGSSITYRATVALAYDGERLDRWILNEFGKIVKMSVTACWDVVKPCLHLDNGMLITGKAMFESTIEEISDEQIDEINTFYNDSNYHDRNENNRTGTGLYSLFINALDAAKEDEFGFPMKEQTLEFLNKQFAELKRKGDLKGLAKAKRKTPLKIEDALTPSGNNSAFNKEKLQDALDLIDLEQNSRRTERGNFQWKDGLPDTVVEWIPDPNGRWEVSKLLGFENNKILNIMGEKYPGNPSMFRGGIDPFSHKETQDSRKSKGASVGFELYDELKDGNKWIVDGNVKRAESDAAAFLTHQPVCTYLYRHDDPILFFEDMILQCVYYGMPVLPESNKPDIINHFNTRGYGRYIINRPKETLPKDSKATPQGAPASELTIEQYFNKISSYVFNYCCAIKMRELVTQLLTMNRGNITKHDLGVAFGWCLIAVSADFADLNDVHSEKVKEDWFEYAED